MRPGRRRLGRSFPYTISMTQKQLADMVFPALDGNSDFREVLLSWIPSGDLSRRNFSLVRFVRINPSEHDPTLIDVEIRKLIRYFDIGGIFETEEEARLFLQSVGRPETPLSEALDALNGAVDLKPRKDDPVKPVEFGFYRSFRPDGSLEISTRLPYLRWREILES